MIGSWGRSGMRCKVREGWETAGREGEAICYFVPENGTQTWVVVVWDGDEDPDVFKAAGLRVKWRHDTKWEDV